MFDWQRATMKAIAGLHRRSREKKMKLFFNLMNLEPGQMVLDVGANPLNVHAFENDLERYYAEMYTVVAVSIDNATPLQKAFPKAICVQGNGCELPFDDRSFDALFSNAVIEHVGNEDVQRRFIHEAVRVSKSGLITTPNFWFPIEQHMNLPFIHYLPEAVRWSVVKSFADESRMAYMQEVHLLSSRRFRNLFPPSVAVDILKLRTTFWPEQLIAHFRQA